MTNGKAVEDRDEVVQKYHEQIFQMLNYRLTEPFRFYTPLIAAFTALGYVWVQSVNVPAFEKILQGTYLIAMLLLLGGIAYIFATSYTYRALQIVLAKLEKRLGLIQYAPDWDPTKRLFPEDKLTLKSKIKLIAIFWIVPEILKAHLYTFFASAILVSIGYSLYACGPIWIVSLCIGLTLVVTYGLGGWYFRKLLHSEKTLRSVDPGRT